MTRKFPNRKRPPPFTPEHKMKISKTLKGRMPKNINMLLSLPRGSYPAWNKGIHIKFNNALALWRKNGGNQKGNKSWNWKGGLTPIRTKLWFSPQYQKWRTGIFLKDNYTCTNCGVRNGNGVGKTIRIEADHYPIPFVYFLKKIQGLQIEEKTLYEAIIDSNELWEAQGRTLCKECHDKTKKGRVTLRSKEEEWRGTR